MLLKAPLPFMEAFVDELDKGLRAHEPDKGLSSTQRKWLGFCLMGILLLDFGQHLGDPSSLRVRQKLLVISL